MSGVRNLVRPMVDEYQEYLHDESRQVGAAQSISFPTTEDEVREILRRMREENISVTIQGNRTGLAAAAVPEEGHILNVEKMTRVLGMRIGTQGLTRDTRCRYRTDPDEPTVYVRVQPGLTLYNLRKYLATRDFPRDDWDEASLAAFETFRSMPECYFPPDPTESTASIGGMAACNSSGSKSYSYSSMRGYVEAVRLALSDGDIISLRRGERFATGRHFSLTTEGGRVIEGDLPSYRMPGCKNAAGYYVKDDMDLIDLLIGSDGTFGVFTELELRTIRMPAVIYGLNCYFETQEQAVSFAEKIRSSCSRVAAVEFMDKNALEIVRQQKGEELLIPDGCNYMLYLEIHANSEDEAMEETDTVIAAMEEAGGDPENTWLAETAADRARLLDMRHLVPETVNMRVAARKRKHPGIAKTGTDMALPDEHFIEVLEMYERDLAEGGYEYAIWGHFGDNHLHVNVIPHSMGEMRRAKEMYTRWAEVILSYGGTVCAEHGAGKIKAPLLALMYGDRGIQEMAAVRFAFDPDHQLGKGTLFKEKEPAQDPKLAYALSMTEKNAYMLYNGIEIDELDIEHCTASVKIMPQQRDPRGYVHGSLFFTMADILSLTLARADGRDYVTMDASVHFIRNGSDGRLTGEAQIVRRGRTSCLCEVIIRSQDGVELSRISVTMFCINR